VNVNAELSDIVKSNKEALLAAMRSCGVTSAVIAYSGSGDSGNGFEVSMEPNRDERRAMVPMKRIQGHWLAEKWETSVVTKEMPLEEALTEFTDDLISTHHDGYENGEGGAGELTFDAAEGAWVLDHRDYFLESVSATHEG